MVENSFEGYIGLFIFYILSINYAIYMDQNLILDPVGSKTQLFLYLIIPKMDILLAIYLDRCGWVATYEYD